MLYVFDESWEKEGFPSSNPTENKVASHYKGGLVPTLTRELHLISDSSDSTHLVFKASRSHSSAPNLQGPFPSVWVILGWSQSYWCACWCASKPASLSHENISCLDTSAQHLETRGQNVHQGRRCSCCQWVSEGQEADLESGDGVTETILAEGWLQVSAAPLSGASAKRFVVGSYQHPRSAPLSPASSISVHKIMTFQGESHFKPQWFQIKPLISNHNGITITTCVAGSKLGWTDRSLWLKKLGTCSCH